uniref:Uncharacterized protein n=1 Tax=Cacopsylla melanoneura TaxID=428564 RepID=A0A8D8R7K6_9HEMI
MSNQRNILIFFLCLYTKEQDILLSLFVNKRIRSFIFVCKQVEKGSISFFLSIINSNKHKTDQDLSSCSLFVNKMTRIIFLLSALINTKPLYKQEIRMVANKRTSICLQTREIR